MIITGDIATSYMDVYDNRILARAKTQYKNIIETLEGTMLCGNEHAYFTGGKVVVGAANPEIMEEFSRMMIWLLWEVGMRHNCVLWNPMRAVLWLQEIPKYPNPLLNWQRKKIVY
ncbi:MAG: hypothetical protein V8R80_03720 [Eubacterium sp.]